MRIIKLICISLLAFLLVSCTEVTNNDKENNIDKPLDGYSYDEVNKRYINAETGIWYIRENNLNIIPAEEYIQPEAIKNIQDFTIENRNNEVWKLKEVQEVTIEVRDGFYNLSDLGYDKHYRMNKDWYYDQVKELNNLEDITIIKWHEKFKIPIYTDIE